MRHLLYFATLVFGCVFFAGCHPSSEKKSISNAKEAFNTADKSLLTKYESADAEVAKKGLIEFRRTVISTKGFNGYADMPTLLFFTDARLATLCQLTDSTNEATQWLTSFLTNFNEVRKRNGKSYSEPGIDYVMRAIAEYDKVMTVRWRIALDQGSLKNAIVEAHKIAVSKSKIPRDVAFLRQQLHDKRLLAPLEAYDDTNVYFNPNFQSWISDADSKDYAIIVHKPRAYLGVLFDGEITNSSNCPVSWAQQR